MTIFGWQDMESLIFLASLVVKKKYSLFDPLAEKNKNEEFFPGNSSVHLLVAVDVRRSTSEWREI